MEHFNVVFIGHVDSGKSTTAGQIMYQTGMIDERVLEKLMKEAKNKGRDGWGIAYIMDTDEQEREKGKTQEVGYGSFTIHRRTESEANAHHGRSFTILDAPGHRSYINHMIEGAQQADIAILIISAKRGEFESGFDKNGQTKEHILLAKSLGVRHLIVAVNKMDDGTVQCAPSGERTSCWSPEGERTLCWSKERYDECKERLILYLRECGIRQGDTWFVPISGLKGINIKEPVSADVCPWYAGQVSLLEYLDKIVLPRRYLEERMRLPVVNVIRDLGMTHIFGTLVSGRCKKGDMICICPGGKSGEICVGTIITGENTEVDKAESGDNIEIILNGTSYDIRQGFVLYQGTGTGVGHGIKEFEAKIKLSGIEGICTSGSRFIMHLHASVQEVVIDKIIGVYGGVGGDVLNK